MTLRQRQSLFARKLPLLINFAYEVGFEITMGDGYRPDGEGHRKNSLHYIKLAQDLNLFRNGRYLRSTKSHRPLGEFWESIGGDWGGRYDDGNHYSLKWKGRR